GITLTPQYREGDAHYSTREDCTYSYDEEKGPPLCEEEQKGVGGRDTEGRRQEQHVAVSIEAPRLPELRRSDRGDLIRYLELVRRYDKQAESWRATRGVECANVNHLD
ncbi:MAG: hypothetical protein GY721_14310, partial [Deltaproteobacteria bacterium]|nr:hypothetical protein [Deltaproteobacteria bacterium]